MEAGYLQPENFALIGIRGLRNGMSWHEAAEELGIRYWTLWDVEEQGIAAVMAAAIKAVAKGCDLLYLSLDLDVIDPAFLPAQKYPDPGGLTARETLRALRIAVDTSPRLAAFDMACLGPDFDVNGLGAQLAARCAVEVIGAFGHRFGRRRK
jgi:arginase family enzyme